MSVNTEELIKQMLAIEPLEDINLDEKKTNNISLNDSSSLGLLSKPLLQLASTVKKQASLPNGNEGVYKVSFKEGVEGTLMKAKEGNNYYGSVMKDGKITSQAALVPYEDGIPFDPVTLAIAVAMISINKKLDDIINVSENILEFLNQDKESHQISYLKTLCTIQEDYKYNLDNDKFINQSLHKIQDIKTESYSNLDFYEKRINKMQDKNDGIHLELIDDSKDFIKQFKSYKLSLYLFSFASFLEVMFLKNFDPEYLRKKESDIKEVNNNYQVFYEKCFDQLEHNTKQSVEYIATRGFAEASKAFGSLLSNVPGVNDLHVDKAVSDFGEGIEKFSEEMIDDKTKSFLSNKDSDVILFVDNIDLLNNIANEETNLYLTDDAIYLDTESVVN